MPLNTCGFFRPQLLHWKHRNVCGQDYRGQVAEGIWHPFKAWFWRYVLGLHLFCFGFFYLRSQLSRVCTSQGAYTLIFTSHSSGICRRVVLWQNKRNSFEVTATMSLLCIYSHIEDGCFSRSRAHTEKSSQTLCFLKPGMMSVLIFNTFLIRDVLWLFCVT